MRLPGVDRPGTEEAGHPHAHLAHCTLHTAQHAWHALSILTIFIVHGCVIECRSLVDSTGYEGGLLVSRVQEGGGMRHAAMRETGEGVY